MATLREYFDTDFARVLNSSKLLQSKIGSELVGFPVRVHSDYDANAKFLSCYLPVTLSNPEICNKLIAQTKELSTMEAGVEVRTKLPGEDVLISGDLYFAGRLFIYHEGEIDEKIKKTVKKGARKQNIFVQFRGPQFALERTRLEKPLAFISHDSRDKDEIARPIAVGLAGMMCPVWFDEFSLKVGDRLRESIERGLKEARKCILILSPHFLSNSGWTKAEFNAIFTREIVGEADVILPVWHGVTRDQVFEYSPTLVDRWAVDWSKGADEAIRKLRKAIGD